MSRVKVEFEFNLNEEQADYEILMRCHKMYFSLCELEASMREAYKYNETINESDEAIRLIEEWREIVRDSEVLDI